MKGGGREEKKDKKLEFLVFDQITNRKVTGQGTMAANIQRNPEVSFPWSSVTALRREVR